MTTFIAIFLFLILLHPPNQLSVSSSVFNEIPMAFSSFTCIEQCTSYSGIGSFISTTDLVFGVQLLWLFFGLTYFVFWSKHKLRKIFAYLSLLLFLAIGVLSVSFIPVLANVSIDTVLPDLATLYDSRKFLIPTFSISLVASDAFLLELAKVYDTGKFLIPTAVIFLLITLLLFRLTSDFRHKQDKIYIPVKLAFLATSISLSLVLWLHSLDNQLVLAILGLILLFAASGPRNLFSRQRAHYRMITRRIRHDRLYDQSSALYRSQVFINRLITYWIPKYFSINNRKLFLTLSIFVGGFIIPFMFRFNPDNGLRDPIEIAVVAILSTIFLVFLYGSIWLVLNSSRFVVGEFSTKDVSRSELHPIAKLSTYMLVEELQRISELLKLRQIENLYLNGEDNNIYFVTSGLDADFLNEIQQAVNLEVPNVGSFSLEKVLSTILRLLARIRVNGTVELRANNSVQIWVELNYRNNRRAAVDLVILPENSYEEIDELVIRPYIREIAIKLFVKLGDLSHLGTSWSSLGAFLDGLEASSQQKWWQAISHYRRAIKEEETKRGRFGIGYYHLGAALVFQGERDEGLQHLRTAEIDGPAMAETKYMLAMVMLQKHWSELAKNSTLFDEIDTYLEQAIALRKRFPEAYHLRGKLYYRRGELELRGSTQQYLKQNHRRDSHIYFYRRAAHLFAVAIVQYGKAYRSFRFNHSQIEIMEANELSLVRQRMTAVHQRADSLRVLSRFSESDSLYSDVFVTDPRTLRNLADMAKNYCLVGDWQRAEEFLLQTVFTHNSAYWNADTNVHMGWAIAGGVADRRYVDRIIELLYWRYQTNPSQTRTLLSYKSRDSYKKAQLREAMQYIDYALHERPRYITSWQQTDWFRPFFRAMSGLGNAIQELSLSPHFITKRINVQDSQLIHYQLWLALRIDGLEFTKESSGEPSNEDHLGMWRNIFRQNSKAFLDCVSSTTTEFAYRKYKILHDFVDLYYALQICRSNTKDLISEMENSKRTTGLAFKLWRLELADNIYIEWQNANNVFGKLLELPEFASFVNRWALDVYLESALLACRLFAEAEGYEKLEEVSSKSLKNFEIWLEKWQEAFADNLGFSFAPRVAVLQRSSLLAWKAFAQFQSNFDFLTIARSNSAFVVNTQSDVLDDIERDLVRARESIYNLPLVMFVQANVYKERGMHSSAIEEYERLLEQIEPYDPKRHIGASYYQDLSAQPTSDPHRAWMYYMEKVSGREQFAWIVNASQIHLDIADIYRDLGESEHRIDHLLHAIRKSHYDDLNVDNFLRLAEQLNNVEQYGSARAIVEAVRIPINDLHHTELSYTKRLAPDIMSCLIDTRSGRHSFAIETSKRIAQQFKFYSFDDYIRSLKTEASNDPRLKPDNKETDYRLKISEHVQQVSDDLFKTDDGKLPGELEQSIILERTYSFLRLNGRFNRLEKHVESRRRTLLQRTWGGVRTKSQSTSVEKSLADFVRSALQDNDPESEYVPRIFRTILQDNDGDIISQIGRIAPYAMNLSLMTKLLRQVLSNPSTNAEEISTDVTYTDYIIKSHVILFFARQAMIQLSHFADICNSLAYSRAESRVQLQYAYQDSTCSVLLAHYLMRWADPGTPRRLSYMLKLAQYCDTYAWVYYRDRLKNIGPEELFELTALRKLRPEYEQRLLRAEQFLKEGIRYDQNRSIIHYHLARVYLTHIEMMWQESPLRTMSPNVGGKAAEIDIYINDAFRHLRTAKEFDTYDRLHQRLTWLQSRITTYKDAWEKRKQQGFAGDVEFELESFDVSNTEN